MTRQKVLLLSTTLALMGMAAWLLAGLRNHQRLGVPGVKTHPLAGSTRLQVDLPATVLDYESDLLDASDVEKGTLPADTSFGRRLYRGADGFQTMITVVLMGSDRSSLHKPQFCLPGQGFKIDQSASSETKVHLEDPISYDLPVVELVSSRDNQRMIYVYWYVAGDQLSASVSGFERMWSMAKVLLTTGVLQRWAYVSCSAICAPGQENATFDRMKQFITAAVPQFQLTPCAASSRITAKR